MRRGGVAAMDRAVEARVDLAVPVLRRGLDEALALREPGIVDQDVQRAEILHDIADHRRDGGEVRDVGLIGLRLAARRRDLGRERLGILGRRAIVDRDAAPSRARVSAISRPTPRPAPVTSATLPFSPRSIAHSFFACARRLDQAEQALGGDGKLVDLDAERRQRIRDGVRDRGRRADGATFAHAAEAAERGRRQRLDVRHVHRRNLAGRRHQIVDQARGVELALRVVDDLLVERGADALRDAAMHLPVDDQRIDHAAAVLGDDEALHADLIGLADRSPAPRYASPRWWCRTPDRRSWSRRVPRAPPAAAAPSRSRPRAPRRGTSPSGRCPTTVMRPSAVDQIAALRLRAGARRR